MEWISILPNLSVGVVSVLTLAYLSKQFLGQLEKRSESHEKAMLERENALRGVEREIRGEISKHLSASSKVIQEATQVMHRVINHLDKH